MEIHKPKPVHSWREFVKEIGSIVLGVSIALAAEQGVEWWHWRNQVAEAREAISREIAFNIVMGMDQAYASHCAQSRLDTLTQVLDEAVKTGHLPPLGDFHQPPLRGWPSGAWTSVLSSQTAAHFPRDELIGLAQQYEYITHGRDLQTDQVNVWSDLHQMAGPGRPFTPAEAAPLRAAIVRARTLDRYIGLIGVALYNTASELKIAFSKEDLHGIDDAVHGRDDVSWVCKPPAPPPQSGTVGALDDAKNEIDGLLKKPPPLTEAK